MTVYGALVARHGLAPSHELLLAAVPAGARVLDVGCADGYLARELKRRGAAAVVGVEGDERAAGAARRWCDEVVAGDVEDPALRAQVAGPFDRVLFGDVLEHLRDPAAVLRWSATLLRAGGRAVVSLPNIAHWTARRQLLRGSFPRDDHGLFDRTHLRFFTRTTGRELVEEAGMAVAGEAFAPAPLPLESRLPALGRLGPPLVRRWPELLALQVVLTCAPRAQASG
jgi:methionine biosynthesis protein MetW